uniref:Cytidine deaminase n=1 Tax=Cajanus cajan TaxID=3821 RepID=A0A151RGW6_CAJCA|nr:Cytidine deaminase [Cajanus cajan]
MEQSRFVIPASEVESREALPSLVSSSEPLVRTPISNFNVAAVGLGASGRAFVGELRHAPDVQILITSDPNPSFTPLSHLLSHHFGPHDLLPQSEPLLLEPRHNNLTLPNPNSLTLAALEAANASHAPYSACPSGVALLDSKGALYKGSYIESAAYNPSLGPLQAALVAFISAGGGDYEDIAAAVLVEKEGALIKQDHTARLLLHSIAPLCRFEAFLAT